MGIPEYLRGASNYRGAQASINLASNENTYGPSPHVVEAIRSAASDVHLYPKDTESELSDALSRYWDIPVSRIVLSSGIDDLLTMLSRAYLGPGDEALYFADSFAKYKISTLATGATPVQIPRDKDQDYRINLEHVASALSKHTRILFLDNPGNPTSCLLLPEQLTELLEILPSTVILALDEAYIEFSDTADSGLKLAQRKENVVVFRTFSKAYALAGMRVGWCTAAAPIVSAMNRMRSVFPLSSPSIAAAVAALEDRKYFETTVAAIKKTRSRVLRILREAGWRVPEPHGNYLMLRFTQAAPVSYDDAIERLSSHRIHARPMVIQGDETVLRLTIGTDAEMDCVLHALLD